MKPLTVWFLLSLTVTSLLLGPAVLAQTGSAPGSAPPSKDFTITSSPSGLSLNPGGSASFVVLLTSVNGFRDRLTLSAASSPTGPSVTLSVSFVTLKPDQTATSQLTVSTSSSMPVGGYAVTVTASGKKISHSVVESVNLWAKEVAPVGDFNIGATPTSLTISPGTGFPAPATANASVVVTSLNEFSGNVNLTATSTPEGITSILDLTIVQLASGGNVTSILTVTSATTGIYSVIITGTSGSLSHSVTVTVNVVPSPVSGVVCLAPVDSLTCPDTRSVFTGTIGSKLIVAVNVRDSDALNAFDVQVKTDPAVLQPVNISLDGTLLQNVLVVVNSTDSANGLVRLAAVALAFHTTAPTAGRLFSIAYNIVGDTSTPISFPAGCNNTSNDSFCVTIANGAIGPVPESLQTAAFSGGQPDFAMSADPDVLVFNGPPVSSVIGLSSVGNFSGSIFLSLIVPVSVLNIGEGLSPTTIDLPANGVATSILQVFSAVQNFTGPPGNFMIIVMGTSGSLSHSVTVAVLIPPQNVSVDFTVSLEPSTVVVPQGSTRYAHVTVTSINGFNGTVYLTAAVFGDRTAPPVAVLEQPVVLVGPDGTGAVVLAAAASINTPLGGYNLTVTGSSGRLSHVFVGGITVVPSAGGPDFTISADPTFLTLVGPPVNSTVTLQSLGNFSGTVDLSLSVWTPSGAIVNANLDPRSVTLVEGGSATSILSVFAFQVNSTAFGGNSTIIITATSGPLSHFVNVEVLILGQGGQDLPPVALFSFFPTSPFVGDNIQFDGSRSFDPDGFVTTYAWDFGDCIGRCVPAFGQFVSHTYFTPGNYTVTLNITDNAGLTTIADAVILVRIRAGHDVSIVSVSPQPPVAVSSQRVGIAVVLLNNGQSPENVTVSAFFDSNLAGTINATVTGQFPLFLTVVWDTTGVAPGNYTISATVFLATDENPADNSLTDGQVVILPPPTTTVTPSMGSLGTKVVVHGSGFPPPPPYGPSYTQVIVTFDDMFMGFTLIEDGVFDFTFNVPHAEPGLHFVKAFDSFSGVSSSVSFTVLAEPVSQQLAANVQVGALYFPGDQADIFVLVTVNGSPSANATIELSVLTPNGTSIALTPAMVQDGLFKASYTIPANGSQGTYAVVATAQSSGAHASALGSFEVKQSWLVQQTPTIASAVSITGVLGVALIAWRKGVFRKKEDPVFP